MNETPETPRTIGTHNYTSDHEQKMCWSCYRRMTSWRNEHDVAWCESCQGQDAIAELPKVCTDRDALRELVKHAEATIVYAAVVLGSLAEKEGGTYKMALDDCDARIVELGPVVCGGIASLPPEESET